ncbi:MAG: hypothetical protein HQ508_02090 [Candidatus Marinimicrobia bacterium]|nr:hypothetical protein [Candidatus Neomarinimicrobiota bacterium]
MSITRNTLITVLTLALSVSLSYANSYDVYSFDAEASSTVSINIIQQNQDEVRGRLLNADETYYVFENEADSSVQLISRTDVQFLETNMDINLYSLLKGKDPTSMNDIIELNDGTRIPSIVLDVGAKNIQYFTGKTMKRESIPAESIYMVYIDNATISIPFPMVAADKPTL